MLSTIILIPCAIFLYAPLLPNGGGLLDWYFHLDIEYRAIFLFLWLLCWGSLCVTFLYPLGLYMIFRRYYDARHRKRDAGTQNESEGTSAVFSTATVITGGLEQEVEDCIRNPVLREIYSRFALEAFHVENVRFLEDCCYMFDHFSHDSPDLLVQEFESYARTVYEQVREPPQGCSRYMSWHHLTYNVHRFVPAVYRP